MNDANPLARHVPRWDDIGPPLRSTAAVAAHMASRIGLHGPVLLLGVTPEFHGVWDEMIAVDRDPDMINGVWPGNGDGQTATSSDWMAMEWPEGSFAGIACDGGLGLLGDESTMAQLQDRCMRWLRPGGTVVHRVFCRTPPDGRTTRGRISDVLTGEDAMGFHGFKMLCNFAYAESIGNSRVRFRDLSSWFDGMFPSRDRLCAETGWSMDAVNTIDLYRDNNHHTMFCTSDEWLATVPADAVDARLETPELGYDLWDQCPVLSWRRAE